MVVLELYLFGGKRRKENVCWWTRANCCRTVPKNKYNLKKIGWTTYNSWLVFWQSFKGFNGQKRDEKMYKESDPIFRCTTPSTGKRLGEVVVGTLYIVYQRCMYSVPTTTYPNLFPVDGVVHRNIGSDFLYIFSSRFWSIKSFTTWKASQHLPSIQLKSLLVEILRAFFQ